MSGLSSTIGGGISQLNAMLGAGHYGTSSESVVALTVVLADGSILRTGARGPDGDTPFYRHYGAGSHRVCSAATAASSASRRRSCCA